MPSELIPGSGLRTIGRPLHPDPSRVVLRPFVPAENGSMAVTGKSRVERILEHVLNLDKASLGAELERVLSGLVERHHDGSQNVERILQRRLKLIKKKRSKIRKLKIRKMKLINSNIKSPVNKYL